MAQPAVPAISAALSGRTVVVTRPLAQCAALVAAIEREGGTALRFPLLEISPLPDCAALEAIAQRLDDFDFACFVSPNAVEHALPVPAAAGRGSGLGLARRSCRVVFGQNANRFGGR